MGNDISSGKRAAPSGLPVHGKIVSEYDQEIPQSQTADNPVARSYTLKEHTLNMEDSTRYLGVELQSSMSWNRHMD